MSVSIHDVLNSIRDSGVAESPAAQAVFARALLEVYGEEFSSEKVFQYVMEHSSWNEEAQARILSVLQSYDGQMVEQSERDLIPARITNMILNDTERWGLTDAQKLEIATDGALLGRWADEYSEKDGFQHLLDYVVDDEIFEWKQAHPAKPSLDQMISAASQRKDTRAADMYICLTPGQDRTWSASAVGLEIVELTNARALIDDKNKRIVITGPDADSIGARWVVDLNNYIWRSDRRERMDYPMSPAIGNYSAAIPLVREESYPAELYYERTDINGSAIMESYTCANREDLLSFLDWLGEAGFVPAHLWEFSYREVADPLISDMFRAGRQRRFEAVQKEMEAFLLDEDEMELQVDTDPALKSGDDPKLAALFGKPRSRKEPEMER